MAINMTNVSRDSLHAFTREAFVRFGLSQPDASTFADALIFSELRFHPSANQGVRKLRVYQKRIADRLVDPQARWEVLKESPSLALVDAHNGIGVVAAAKAMKLAIAKAKECGIGQVIVRNSTHYGSSAVHACQAEAAGCIGIAYTNAGPEMAPWGACEEAVGTNPWSIVAPTNLGFPAVMDFALTRSDKGAMQWLLSEGKKMPLDWALTPEGEITDDPNAAMQGALLGIGDYKGYGLAFMTDVLTGVIAGGAFGLVPYSNPARQDVSHSLTAIDIEWFMPLATFRERMGEFAQMVKSRKTRPGVAEILIPGELEARRVERKSKNGVPLVEEVLTDLLALREELKITSELEILVLIETPLSRLLNPSGRPNTEARTTAENSASTQDNHANTWGVDCHREKLLSTFSNCAFRTHWVPTQCKVLLKDGLMTQIDLPTEQFRMPQRLALAETVADSIASAISAGHLSPGEKITDSSLADLLGVSRVAVREALKILLAQGIVNGKPNRGYRVVQFDPATVEKVLEIRLALESFLLRDAIKSWRERGEMANELEPCLQAMRRAAMSLDRPASLAADMAFHRAIANAANNEIARVLWETIARHVMIIFSRHEYRDDDLASVVRQHEAFRDLIHDMIKADSTGVKLQKSLEDHLMQVARVRSQEKTKR
ncbi:Ldh family oxidoreductase [Mesorhizobium sp. WSM4887]|uniref:Ldh family oxidoreductase n=2 Tax=unclassified Mesorhizobium TaxID=325217 RepID=UPI002417E448|nr:Ldh family oxidoreductase [Mesorhizobium sp. WSM4887]MDG4889748.1 Ldh family oxidoreductase [Mesorhizobium sp. WSM4887]